ncbi:MAG: GDSL-type esterase/lipase family protein [Acidobacteriota bacterium]
MSVPTSRLRRLMGNLMALAASVLVSLLLAEGAVRWLAPQPLVETEPGLYEADPPRRFRLQPGHRGRISNLVEFDTIGRIDARGLRVADDPASPPPSQRESDARRLLVVGDSFVFGWGVDAEDALPAQLEAILAAREDAASVENGGVPGYGLPDVADWFEVYGLDLAPDVLIVCVFLGNDLLDATEAARAAPWVEGDSGGVRRSLHRGSHFLRLVKRSAPPGLQRRLRALVGLDEAWELAYLRQAFGSFAKDPPPAIEEGRVASSRSLARLAERARQAGVEPMLVLLPAALQVDSERWLATTRLLEVDPMLYDPEVPNRFFARQAAELGLPLVDLLPSFRAAEGPLYFTYDPHWTVAGHRLAAERIARSLLRPEAPALSAPDA